jgi:hypothetical protein
MTNLVGAWLLRRALEIGGLVGAVVTLFMALPPETQASIAQLLTGRWQDITLGALAPIAVALWGYVWSWRSTFRPQVVVDRRQVPLDDIAGGAQVLVEESARTAARKKPRRKTILDWFRR